MRTTLVIADPVYERAQRAAERAQRRLSELVTEAIDAYLLEAERAERAPAAPVQLKPHSMGRPMADINNRDELHRRMEE